MDSLLGGYQAHVLAWPLPTPVVVQFNLYGPEIAVQPDGGLNTVQHLGNLLVWAHTLTDITAEWWRTADDRLHVSVRGRTTGGARLHVYGGCKFTDCRGLLTLAPGQSEGISLDDLYTLVGLLREAQQDRREA